MQSKEKLRAHLECAGVNVDRLLSNVRNIITTARVAAENTKGPETTSAPPIS